jgi:transposase-like protein
MASAGMSRHLLAFLRSQGGSQADWVGLLEDLSRRTGGPIAQPDSHRRLRRLGGGDSHGYPWVRHQRCWVHKMRNIPEKARKRDYDEVKAGAQATYLAVSRAQGVAQTAAPPTSSSSCFVEVRRRTRSMVCFVNVESVDRIIYSIFQRFNLEWKTRTLNRCCAFYGK